MSDVTTGQIVKQLDMAMNILCQHTETIEKLQANAGEVSQSMALLTLAAFEEHGSPIDWEGFAELGDPIKVFLTQQYTKWYQSCKDEPKSGLPLLVFHDKDCPPFTDAGRDDPSSKCTCTLPETEESVRRLIAGDAAAFAALGDVPLTDFIAAVADAAYPLAA